MQIVSWHMNENFALAADSKCNKVAHKFRMWHRKALFTLLPNNILYNIQWLHQFYAKNLRIDDLKWLCAFVLCSTHRYNRQRRSSESSNQGTLAMAMASICQNLPSDIKLCASTFDQWGVPQGGWGLQEEAHSPEILLLLFSLHVGTIRPLSRGFEDKLVPLKTRIKWKLS